jgi:bromodomain-containing factor 1
VVKALPHLPAEFNARSAPADVVDTTPAKSGKPKKNKPMGKAEQEAKIKQLEAVQKAVAGGGSGGGATAASEQPMQSIEQDHVAPDADEDSDEESSEEE